ncbi:cilia- and flagella-associated protein 251 [Pholidichthys leucotaenia]
MSTAEARGQDPSKNCEVENQQEHGGAPGDEEEEPRKRSNERAKETEKNRISGQSKVYTATRDTLFSKKTTPTGAHALTLEWVHGMNPFLPAFNLQDHDQLVVLYAAAHVGVIYNHTLNSQHILKGHANPISCMCVSEDRRWIGTADQGPESTVIIWDSYSGIPVHTIFNCHSDAGVIAMAFSSDTKHLATLSTEKVQYLCIWDWTNETQKPLCFTEINPEHGFQGYIIFRPNDNTQLLSSSESHLLFYSRFGNLTTIRTEPVKLPSFKPTIIGTMGAVSFCHAVFHWREPQILTAIEGSIVVWDVSDPNQIKSSPRLPLVKHPITVLTVTDGCFVIADTQGNIHFYDEWFRVLTWYTELNLDAIVSISFSKEFKKQREEECTTGNKLSTIRNFVVSTISSTVVHVNAQGGVLKTILQEDYEPIHTVACHPGQTTVAMGNQKGILKIWDYNNKVIIGSRFFKMEKQIRSVAFDPKGWYLAVGFGNGAVHILNPNTLQSDPEEGFHYTKDSIHLIAFSSDSKYLATADTGKGVTVFRLQTSKESVSHWMCVGRNRSHYKPIKDLLFGVHLDSTQPRLLSLGMDRRLVEYDLENSNMNQLFVVTSQQIEQSAIPTCMTWYPPLTTEQFLLLASDQYKLKLFNSTTKMCRKTLLGPTYGSAIKQIFVLPKTETNVYNLAFITEDKVGLHILPLDGNPYKSNAVACHTTGVSTFACSYDGQFVFTAGETDCTVLVWEINLSVLEAAAALGGQGMAPFYALLEGGKDGKFYKEMEDYFYYCQIHHQGIDSMERRQVSTKIPLSEVPILMRALAYFPSEQEIEDMQNEVKFSKYAQTGQYVTDIDLNEFIKLFVNHRPAFGISSTELVKAFRVLGHTDSTGQPVLQRHELLELLRVRGEHMTEEEVAECFATLLGHSEEEEEGAVGGSEHDIPKNDSEYSLRSAIPDEISLETFTSHILGFPSSAEESDKIHVSQEESTDLAAI